MPATSHRMKLSAAAIVFSGILALSGSAAAGHGNGGGHGNAGGNSADHISAHGLANSNGPNADERLFGSDRADFRHSMHTNNLRATHHRRTKHGNLHDTSFHGRNGWTPPGWSHGKKTGWGCTPGSANCMPPGLAKKQK